MTKRLANSAPPPTAAEAARTPAPKAPPLDVGKLRADFPILRQSVHGKPLVYLDNAATTQKPQVVIDAVTRYYTSQNANIHRGVYTLSQEATALHEQAREKVRRFINAAEPAEIIFTRSATESINLVAASFGRQFIKAGDEIILSGMEHHSNIVPWQILRQQTGAVLRVIPFDDNGQLILEEYEKQLGPGTKLVSIVHLSNSLGTINPVRRIIELAHRHGAAVLVDGAQWVAHAKTDVRELDCDFHVFSGHKVFGPTGIGVLYGKRKLLDAMPPYQGGGDMIGSVTFEQTTYNDLPYKFEAGTPNIAGAIGLGAAIDYLDCVGLESMAAWEHELFHYATQRLREIPRLRIVGTARERAAVISFVLEGIHPHDIGTILDGQGVAIRTGHHCCQPVMDRLGIPATARASIAAYNTKEEIDALVAGIGRVIGMIG
jgi:cysteine desulfurase/selenocysteine lyase